MTIIHQPTRKTCGQTCLAMVANTTVEQACVATGKSKWKGTTTKDLQRGLAHFKISHAPGKLKTRRAGDAMPQRAILRCNKRFDYRTGRVSMRGGWHWVLVWDGKFYDPSPACGCGTGTCKCNVDPTTATSYLEIA